MEDSQGIYVVEDEPEVEFQESETATGFHSISFQPPPTQTPTLFALPKNTWAQPVDHCKALILLCFHISSRLQRYYWSDLNHCLDMFGFFWALALARRLTAWRIHKRH